MGRGEVRKFSAWLCGVYQDKIQKSRKGEG